MRVSLGPLGTEAPRTIDPYTFAFGDGTYRGTFSLERQGDAVIVVNTLPLDAYLYGVVSREVSPSWPRAALQAQAIAARTYAYLRRRPAMPYDVVASTSDQFYGGVGAEAVEARDAVDSTSGHFVLWNGAPAHVLYGSCCGGFTASAASVRSPAPPLEISFAALDDRGERSSLPASATPAASAAPGVPHGAPIEPTAAQIDAMSAGVPQHDTSVSAAVAPAAPSREAAPYAASAPNPTPGPPYLAEHADPYCVDAPQYRWRCEVPFDDPGRYFGDGVARDLGTLRSVAMGEIDASGRPSIVRLVGTKAAFAIDSADLRRRLGATVVRSTRLTQISYTSARTLALEGTGFGHGAGLCQWGARGMAAGGAEAAAIVAFYFPGTTLGEVS